MGRPKPLLPLGDQPVIRRCLQTLRSAGINDITVVLGHGAAEVEKTLGDLPLTLVKNPDGKSDMAGSIRVGLHELSAETTGVLVCLVDHPLVCAATIGTLLQHHAEKPGVIVIPTFQGRKGHPTLFPRSVIDELFQLATLRHVVRRDSARVCLVDVPDEGVVLDMDTPEEYQRALEMWRKER